MISFFKQHNKIFLAFLFVLIFLFSFSVHYLVYRHEGYVQVAHYNMLTAKNWAQTGQLSYESQENVVLSSESLKTQGVPTNLGNKLTFYIYGMLFRIFGFHTEMPLYTAFTLYSLSAFFIFLIIKRAFDLKTGLVAVFLLNLAPFSLPFMQMAGSHEWAFFFFVLASFFYFWPKERKLQYLILSGLLLGLSAAARNSFFVTFPPFVILEFWRQRESMKLAVKKALILSFGFLITVIPFTFLGGNVYFSELLDQPNTYDESFTILVHLFPDPYTFHYDRENFIKEFVANMNNFPGGQFRLWGDVGSFLEEYGYKIGFFKAEIVTRLYSFWIYFKGLFLSAIVFGGLLSWFLIFVGAKKLADEKKYLFPVFGAVFFASWFSLLIFLKTSNYVHLLNLTLPIVFLMSPGIVKLSEIVSNSFNFKKIKPSHSALVVILMFLIFFAQISWWTNRELSTDYGFRASLQNFAKAELAKPTIAWQKVTMEGWSKDSSELLAYYLNRDFIYFNPNTIKKLAEQKKLADVMKQYNISGYIGFDADTSEIIRKNTRGLNEYKFN